MPLQDDLYKPNYYQGLMDFREQTLQRLQKYVDQRFFQTMDYLKGDYAPHLRPQTLHGGVHVAAADMRTSLQGGSSDRRDTRPSQAT